MSELFNCSFIVGELAPSDTMTSMSNYDTSSSADSFQGAVTLNIPGIRALLSSNSSAPYLRVTEEPVEKFRFRYKSEMMGTHGSILARSHERNRRKIYPTVQLCNYHGPAVIRCSLYTAHQNEKLRTLHTHRLIVRAENNSDKDDPHEMIVSQDNNYTAVFHGMGIIHTAKKNIIEELMKKKQNRLLEKLRAKNINNVPLTSVQNAQLRREAEEESRKMNLNSVSLCFEAFTRDSNNCLHQICEPVFSKPINNMKSALTGELKICRIDKNVSTCLGGEEIFVLVEKVGKKNIQIKFFEVDEDENEVWSAYGKFSELDVHHQYAIVFRTPPYRCPDIEKPVDVYLQLYRPTDGDRSEPIPFQYKPSDKMGRARKRQRLANESLHSEERHTQIINALNGGNASDLLSNAFNNFSTEMNIDKRDSYDFSNINLSGLLLEDKDNPWNSSDFRECMNNIQPDLLPQTNSGLGSLGSETLKMPVNCDMDSACTAAFVFNHSDISFPGGLKTEGFVPRGEYFAHLEECLLEDLADDGEHCSVTSKGVSVSTLKITSPTEETKHSSSDVVTVKKEQTGDIHLLHKVLGELQNILIQKVSNSVFKKKIEEIFSVTNNEEENALHVAAVTGQEEILELLLQALERDQDCSKKLINSQNSNAETPLHLAVLNNYPKIVKMLLLRGADPYVGNKSGNTSIHVAIANGHDDCLIELLEKKNYCSAIIPKYNIKDETGRSPLHLSVLKNNLFAVKRLVEMGADVNDAESTTRNHALILASELGYTNIVEYLVKETPIDVNMMNYSGYTALHYACVVNEKGSPEICEILIDAKADPRKVNFEQRSQAAKIQASLDVEEIFNVEIKEEIKEEIESEDDMELRIDDEEEEDDEDDDEISKGQSSMDLAKDNEEILEILKKGDVASSVFAENELLIKTECISPSESVSDNGLFDEETLAKLCSILDSSNVWINLADLLDYSFLVPSIRNATSPTKLLFNYADLHGNVTVQNIRNFLEALDENEAVEAIDLMLAQRISNNQGN